MLCLYVLAFHFIFFFVIVLSCYDPFLRPNRFILFSLHKFSWIKSFGLFFALFFESGLKPNAFPTSRVNPSIYLEAVTGPGDPTYCWKLVHNVQKPKKWAVYVLYTALYTDMQV
ncbi:hypothetical protein R3W88_018282 [Solanum pinnatisectum]|uniref:Secreted protein n=1 Tax=Solanum pinnatisectum TaxID=50273 RepID=A0AAV9L577_9SOLN|nr:hypothetical protein R3W88_018282 [Solanum pinnatisectum]